MDRLQRLKSHTNSIFSRYGYLSILLIPFGVMALSSVLFESISVETVEQLKRTLAGEFQVTDPSATNRSGLFSEIRARYFWLTSALLNIGTPLYVSITGIIIISQCHQGKRVHFILILTLILCLLNLAALQYAVENQGAIYRLVYGTTAWCLASSHRFSEEFLQTVENIIATVNICSSIAPVIIAIAFASSVSPLKNQDQSLSDLALLPSRMRFLKSTLKLAAALLVIGILHMNAWLQWPGILIQDETLRAEYSQAALSVSVYWGATFTLMLFLTYGPAASYLGLQARNIIEPRLVEVDQIKDRQKWLKDNDLSVSFGDQIPQLLIMLSPMIAGPLQFFFMHTG